ncbi:MAG: 2,3-bisphosphoglycerate-independent phosphoglycerate mutase [Patescibacteria group bacterium]
MSTKSVVLVILDGWGIGKQDRLNPIYAADLKNIGYIKANFPSGALQASGIAVGLPWGEEGNSEVGHLSMGSGKILYQNYPRISLAIRDASFFKNEILKKAAEHVRKNNSSLNLFGLLTEANVHASLEHLDALIKFAEQEKINYNLHFITDGRDSPPQSALELLSKIPKEKLASIAGRYYAMDRDKRWDRTQTAYKVLTGEGPLIDELESHVKKTYERGLNDEYVEPALIGPENRGVKDGDALIFFNFREDRMRQIVEAFINKNFDKFPVKSFSNLYIATMVNYGEKFQTPVIFQTEKITNPLSKVLADNNKNQFRIAETEKYAHITYFFNAQEEKPFKNEYRVLVPSRKVLRYDEFPEMMANEITNRAVEAIEENVYDFVLINYANPDIIGHTGNFQAGIQAVKIIDEQMAKIVKAVLGHNAVLIITSDHGNIERMVNPVTGMPETKHDTSLVPIYLVAKEYERQRSEAEIRQSEREIVGVLSDIAPTILELLNIPKPKEMTGQSLLKFLITNF